MNGFVDEIGRAIVRLRIYSPLSGQSEEISAWIDTAFNGELVIPHYLLATLGLDQSAVLKARLADGNEVLVESFSGTVEWFEHQRPVEVIANDGQFPLLGTGLLIGHRLMIDYEAMTVTIE